MLNYPHHVKVTREASAGSYDDRSVWTPPSDLALVVYDGPADVQDEGRELQRANEGTETVRSDALVFFGYEAAAFTVRPDDLVEIDYRNGHTATARVNRVRLLDGSALVRWLAEPSND